jgi:hypothetical protein
LAAFTELWTLLLPLTNIFAWAKTISVSSQLSKLKDWADCAGRVSTVTLSVYTYFNTLQVPIKFSAYGPGVQAFDITTKLRVSE